MKVNTTGGWREMRLSVVAKRPAAAIGSGLIEGACKTAVGGRLKLNNARWRVRRAERIGALRGLDYSAQCVTCWCAATIRSRLGDAAR